MKILLLCKKFPFPLKDGESIAIYSLSRALHELGCEVSLLAMNTSKHYYDHQALPPELSHFSRITTVDVDNRIKPLAALHSLLRGQSYHISRFVSDEYARVLRQLLTTNSYDVVQLETLYLAPYLPLIRQYSQARVALRAHNIEHEIWERICEHSPLGLRRWYLSLLTRQLRDYELAHLNDYDLLVPITPRDEQKFRELGCRIEAVTVPIGLNTEGYRADYSSFKNHISLSFIGSLDWLPNAEGLRWFIERVWPRISQRFPHLQFHIAGRNTPEWVRRISQRNIVVHGEVPQADTFINAHSMMVVPLLSGSGMRAKILEAMALGKVVLTTSVGLEGIDARDHREVMIADTPDHFLLALEECHSMNGSLQRMGHRAQSFIQQHYDRRAVASQLLRAYTAATAQPTMV